MAIILITGISGSLAQMLANRLLDEGHRIIGVDYREPRFDMRPDIQFYKANYNKRPIEDIFSEHRPSIVFHLGRVNSFRSNRSKRFDLNVIGSKKIMEESLKYNVKRLIVLSTFHIYGAHPHNHIPIFEEEPLRATQGFVELSDAVQIDNQVSTWIYRYPKLKTVVLRPCNIIGPHIRNAISSYLSQERIPYLLGYSPMFQFIHELDMLQAIYQTMNSDKSGVYNVTGPGEIPIIKALKLSGSPMLPIPKALASIFLKTYKSKIPSYFLDFLKYPCVISGEKFRKDFNYEAKINLTESIKSTVWNN